MSKARQVKVLAAAVLMGLVLGGANASVHTQEECSEGAQMMFNTASGRDIESVRRDDFLMQMQADFMYLRSLPPSVRWFVQDEQDERLLYGHAQRIWSAPQKPAEHAQAFLQACMAQNVPASPKK